MSDCIFCKIAAGEIPAKLVHQNDRLVAFRDLNPQAPVHILIVPRKHVASLDDARPEDAQLLGELLVAARAIAAQEGIAGGYRLVANCGPSAGQSVFHLHLHLMGGRSFGWPPG